MNERKKENLFQLPTQIEIMEFEYHLTSSNNYFKQELLMKARTNE